MIYVILSLQKDLFSLYETFKFCCLGIWHDVGFEFFFVYMCMLYYEKYKYLIYGLYTPSIHIYPIRSRYIAPIILHKSGPKNLFLIAEPLIFYQEKYRDIKWQTKSKPWQS